MGDKESATEKIPPCGIGAVKLIYLRGLIELTTSPGKISNALIPQGKGEKVR